MWYIQKSLLYVEQSNLNLVKVIANNRLWPISELSRPYIFSFQMLLYRINCFNDKTSKGFLSESLFYQFQEAHVSTLAYWLEQMAILSKE